MESNLAFTVAWLDSFLAIERIKLVSVLWRFFERVARVGTSMLRAGWMRYWDY
jgi:hypothetical protein